MKANSFWNVLWNLTKIKWFSKTHLGFYADVNFLYGHTKKFVKNYLDPKQPIQIKQSWKFLPELPIVIYYSTIGESQLINNLILENPPITEKETRECFQKSIKDLPINILEAPYSNGVITPKMIRDLKGIDKGKYEDAIHIAIASTFDFPLITGEKGRKLEIFKQNYNLTVSTSKFWNYVNLLYNKLISGEKVDKKFALNFLFSDKFL